MKSSDRAVGLALIFVSVICGVAIFFLSRMIFWPLYYLVNSMAPAANPSASFNLNGAVPQTNPYNPSPPAWTYLVFLAPLFSLVGGYGIFRSRRWGFQIAIFIGLIFSLTGQFTQIPGVALALYAIVRLARLFPDEPKTSVTDSLPKN